MVTVRCKVGLSRPQSYLNTKNEVTISAQVSFTRRMLQPGDKTSTREQVPGGLHHKGSRKEPSGQQELRARQGRVLFARGLSVGGSEGGLRCRLLQVRYKSVKDGLLLIRDSGGLQRSKRELARQRRRGILVRLKQH